MKQINLRKFYSSIYMEDTYIIVSDEIADALEEEKRKVKAMYAKIAYHGAYYSLNRDDGIENHTLFSLSSPDEMLEQKQLRLHLYATIMELPSKQAKRLYAYFLLRMKLSDIARMEGVNEPAIWKSIQRALKGLRNKMNKYFKWEDKNS